MSLLPAVYLEMKGGVRRTGCSNITQLHSVTDSGQNQCQVSLLGQAASSTWLNTLYEREMLFSFIVLERSINLRHNITNLIVILLLLLIIIFNNKTNYHH